MKKILLSLFVIGSFGLYTIYYGKEKNLSIVTTPDTTLPSTSTSGSTTYKDGEYTGSRADAYYGYIQVKATVKGGQLADVVFLEYPNDRDTSIRISKYAMPILKSEAITAQNSNVDAVSGATDSSRAFRESLANALLQAKV